MHANPVPSPYKGEHSSRYHLISNKKISDLFIPHFAGNGATRHFLLNPPGLHIGQARIVQKFCSEATFHLALPGCLSAGEHPLWRGYKMYSSSSSHLWYYHRKKNGICQGNVLYCKHTLYINDTIHWAAYIQHALYNIADPILLAKRKYAPQFL